MYKLYYSAGTCSLAIHALLNELNQPFELVAKSSVDDFTKINPRGAVPALADGDKIILEGAAIVLYLLEKHKSEMLPTSGDARINVIQWLMFANATVHPAYSKMFFSNRVITDNVAKSEALKAGAAAIEKLWQDVDTQLAKTAFVCGDKPTAADFLLAVYANWGGFFPVEIKIGDNVKRMFKEIVSRPSFQKALATENVKYRAA